VAGAGAVVAEGTATRQALLQDAEARVRGGQRPAGEARTAVVAATAGNLVGSLIAYALGATRALERIPGAGGVLRSSERLLERHGTRAVLIARLLPLARTFVSLPAGARRIPLPGFVAMTLAGCTIWASAFTAAGALAGTAWATVSTALGRILLVGGLVLMAAVFKRRS